MTREEFKTLVPGDVIVYGLNGSYEAWYELGMVLSINVNGFCVWWYTSSDWAHCYVQNYDNMFNNKNFQWHDDVRKLQEM